MQLLTNGDFAVWESPTVASYLNEKFNLPKNRFDDTAEKRTNIQQYCHWHATYLSRGTGAFFYANFAECIWGKQDFFKEIAKGRHMLHESLEVMEALWLGDSAYLCGDEISFADLLGYHEPISHVAGKILGDPDWRKYPKVKKWHDRLAERPHAEKVSEMILAFGAMRLAENMIPMTRTTSRAKGTEIKPGTPEKLSRSFGTPVHLRHCR